jgi:NAD(P)-dependent dehydrogenase (short-subunit alcohol dehydrogenase family)
MKSYMSKQMMQLEGQQVIVLGGSSGIGLATASLAKQAGASVTITGRSEEKLRQAATELDEAQFLIGDIADETAVRNIFEKMDSVDHVFFAAGGLGGGGRITETDIQDLRPAIDERLWGSVYVAKYAAPLMSSGSITLMSGLFSSRPIVGFALPAAAVGAVESLSRALALELAPIRVNALAPGFIDTPLIQAAFGEKRDAVVADIASKLPTKRIGAAQEIAQAALFLMTNEFMTGEVLHIDGGGCLI